MPVTSLFHISDIHIRAGTSEASREDEYRATFDNLFGLLKTFPQIQKGEGIIVLTGDLFHHKNVVGPAGLDLAIYLLRGLSALATTVVIRGNHDYRQELSDEKDMIRALMAYDIEDLHYFDETGIYEVETIGFGVLAIQDTLLEGATAGSKDVMPAMPSVEGFSEDVTHRVALYHGEVTKASLQTGYIHSNRHTLPLTQFEGYDLVLLGDIHQQQVKVAEPTGYSGSAGAEATQLTTYTTRTGSWGYPSSLLQQNYGESLLGHGLLHWDLARSQVTEYHVHNPVGFVPLSVDAEGKIRIQVRKGADTGGWMEETVLDEPWFPKRVKISVSGTGVRLTDTLLDRIRVAVEAHGIHVERIHPSYSSASSGPSGPSESSGVAEGGEDSLSSLNSSDSWIQYIEEKTEHRDLLEKNSFWKAWFKEPGRLLVPLEGIPPSLKSLVATQNEKIFKAVTAFQKELEAFAQESRQTTVLSLQYLEWSWLFNFGPENWYNFADASKSIVVLNAKNGCGKSNFFETICIALFGEGFPSRECSQSAAILNNRWTGASGASGAPGEPGASSASQGPAKTLVVVSLHGVEYSIERVFERRKDRRLLDFKSVVLKRYPSGDLVFQGINAVRQWVTAHLGTVDTFLTSCMLTQDGDGDFFEKGADQQKEILDRVFSLHVVDELKTLLDVTHRAHGTCWTAVQAYVGGKEVGEGTAEEAGHLETEQGRIRERRTALEAEALLVAGRWADHSPKTFTARSLESYREEWGRLAEGEECNGEGVELLQTERARLRLKLEGGVREEPPVVPMPSGSKARVDSRLDRVRADLATVVTVATAVTAVTADTAVANRTLEECKAILHQHRIWEEGWLRRKKGPIGMDVATADQRLATLMAAVPSGPTRPVPARADGLEEAARGWAEKEATVATLEAALAQYDEPRAVCTSEPFNPECEACVSRKGLLEKEAQGAKKRRKGLQATYGSRAVLRGRLEEAQGAAAAAVAARDDWAAWTQAQAVAGWTRQVQAAQADVDKARLQALFVDEERHWVRQKKDAQRNLGILLRAELVALEAEAAAWASWEARRQWEEAQAVGARLAVVETRLRAIEASVQRARIQSILEAYPAYVRDKELIGERAALEAEGAGVDRRLAAVRAALEGAAVLEALKNIEVRREVAGALAHDIHGYTRWLSTEKLVPRIVRVVSGLLEGICEDRPLTLDAVWEDKGSGHLVWFLVDGTSRIVFQKASGFQRFIVGMAMRLAMSRLGLCRAEYRQLFLDEGFTACDGENLERVPAFLRSLLGGVDTILLASHLEDLKASGDVQVRIERIGGGSARLTSGSRLSVAPAEGAKPRGRPRKAQAHA